MLNIDLFSGQCLKYAFIVEKVTILKLFFFGSRVEAIVPNRGLFFVDSCFLM